MLVWLANLVYFIYFVRNSAKSKHMLIQKGGKIEQTKVRLIPMLVFRLKLFGQEICIGIILSIILLFSFTKNTGFETSKT